MVTITIDGIQTQMGRAVSLYGAHLLPGLTDFSFIGLSRTEENKHGYDLTLPTNKKNIVPYHDLDTNELHNIEIEYICKSDTPMNYENGMIGFYTVVSITGPSRQILTNFMESARRHVKEVMYSHKKSDKKITCYIFDKMWISLNRLVKRKLDTVYLPGKQAKTIVNDIESFLDPKTAKLYYSLGRPYKRNYLFEGPPGTGKSSLIYALASHLDMGIAIINFSHQIDDTAFIKALQRLPDSCILVLEDIDCLFEARKANDDQKNMITFSGLLNTLDGLMHKDKLITIMTTNYKNKLDSALIRPGRVDRIYHFDIMKREQMKKMFDKFFPDTDEKVFTDFMKKYKESYLKITAATLQEYFFCQLGKDDLCSDFELLQKIAQEHTQPDHSRDMVI